MAAMDMELPGRVCTKAANLSDTAKASALNLIEGVCSAHVLGRCTKCVDRRPACGAGGNCHVLQLQTVRAKNGIWI